MNKEKNRNDIWVFALGIILGLLMMYTFASIYYIKVESEKPNELTLQQFRAKIQLEQEVMGRPYTVQELELRTAPYEIIVREKSIKSQGG